MLVLTLIGVIVVYTGICAYLVFKAELPDTSDMQVYAPRPRSLLKDNPFYRFLFGKR